jgi:hypothetical protein
VLLSLALDKTPGYCWDHTCIALCLSDAAMMQKITL